MMDTKKLRQKVLDLAIRGKLVPQDPNDEPASVLLERIREEKERLIKEGKIKRDKKEKTSDKSHYRKSITNCQLRMRNEEVPFEIPESWVWTKIKDIFEINPKNDLNDEITVSFVPMALISDSFNNKHSSEIKKWKEIKKGFTHFRNGDVGIAKITPCFENRKSVVLENLENNYGAGTTELHILRPILEPFISNYLIWFVKTEDFITNGVNCFTGAVGQQRIGKNIIEDTYFPLPPLSEQHRIVQKIEECFIFIDQIEENKLSLIQFIKQTKSKVLDLAIRGKLVPQDPNDEPASVLLERIKKEQKAKKPTADILHYPFEVPKNWVWCKLGEIVFSIKNGSTMKQSKGALGIPITRIETISDGSVNYGRMGYANIFDSLDYASYILKENDILMSHINSPIHVGKTAIYKPKEKNEKIIHGMNLLRIRLQYVINSDFANYFFNSQFFKDSISPYIKNAVNQASINIGNLNIIQIPIPPLAEQHRIVSKIEHIFTQLDAIENSIKA